VRLLRILIALGLVLSSCTFGSRHAHLLDVTLSGDETTLWVSVDTCNADLTAWITETEESVVVDVIVENDTNDDCADGLTFELSEPLGNRPVIDGPTGDVMLVRRTRE
jgi:hypothetical protein